MLPDGLRQHGPAGTVLVGGVDHAGLLDAWQVAEALVPVTGCLPLMVTDDFVTSLRPQPQPDPRAPTAADVRAFDVAARASDPWLTFRHWSDDDEVNEGEVEYYTRGIVFDLRDRVPADLRLPIARPALQRVLYDLVLADGDLTAQVMERVGLVTDVDYWFRPDGALLGSG